MPLNLMLPFARTRQTSPSEQRRTLGLLMGHKMQIERKKRTFGDHEEETGLRFSVTED